MSDLAYLAFAIVIASGCYVGARMSLPRHDGGPRIRRPYVTKRLRR